MRPSRPHFSSGPCVKRPGWSLEGLEGALLGRSHRSAEGLARLQAVLARTRSLLQLPDSHRLAITPGSDTGAVEMCLWSMLGPRPVQVLAFDTFGRTWAADIVDQLGLAEVEVLAAADGWLPDLARVRGEADLVFTWNGTTSGVCVPDGGFIAADRGGLTICDATSAAFAGPLPWDRLDATTFSWQKALGGEAAHGMLVLGPRAVERLERFRPARALPKLFRMTGPHGLNEDLFQGWTLNTPSLLCVEDVLDALRWGEAVGGLAGLTRRTEANFAVLEEWVARTAWIDFVARDPATRSRTSVCLRLVDGAAAGAIVPRLVDLLEREGVAFDIAAHRSAPAGLRIWCGPTVEPCDLEALTPWLDWAFATAQAERLAGDGLKV